MLDNSNNNNRLVVEVQNGILFPVSHCRVLPPGEHNDMILELLPIYLESLMMIGVTGFS